MYARPYKVALFGTHGVGKTTTMFGIGYHLQRLGISTAMIYEVARKSKFTINEAATPDHQCGILTTQLNLELEMCRGDYGVVLCDRAVLDNLAYYLASVKRSNMPDPHPWLEKMVLHEVSTYDLMIFIEPDVELESDGIRSTNKEFQMEIHELVGKLIGKAFIPNLITLQASESRREEKVLELSSMIADAVKMRI